MREPSLVPYGPQGALVLSEASFVHFICKLGTHQEELLKFPGVTRKILVRSRKAYRDKYGAMIIAAHKKNLALAARSRRKTSPRPPATLLDKVDLQDRLAKGQPVQAIADALGTTEWFVMRNCSYHGLTQEYVASKVLDTPELDRLASVFPYLDPRRPTPEALERATVEVSRLGFLLRRLGAVKAYVSAGEAYVAEQLIQRGVRYIREYFVSEHTYGTGNRRVDFYLPDFQAAIEVDGRFHKDQAVRDQEVVDLCKKRHIKLHKIPYLTLTQAFRRQVSDVLDTLHH